MSRAKRLKPSDRVENYGVNPLGHLPEEALAKLTPRQRRRVIQKNKGNRKLW